MVYKVSNEKNKKLKEGNVIDVNEGIKGDKIENDLLLVKGDISGIQEFIFNVQSKGAAKSLRGRSAYISFLTLVIVEKIKDELKDAKIDLIYIGGGNFYLTASKTHKGELEGIRFDILNQLYKEFEGDIYLAMDWVDITLEEIKGDISKKWSKLNEIVRKKGSQKWSELIIKGDDVFYNNFFTIGDVVKETEICPVCKKNYKESNKKIPRNDNAEEAICESCDRFMKFGESVRNAKSLDIRNLGSEKLDIDELEILGYKLSVSKEKKDNYTYHFNEKESKKNLYFPTHCPEKEDENKKIVPKDFSDLARDSEGASKLGILKLDVDNLGGIFENKSTFQELKETSKRIKEFFERRLNELILKEDYRNYIYIIFSGGDDTFVIGSYNRILDFAQELKKEFDEEFKNDGYTFSAGLLIADDKQSVKSFSTKVEDYLDKAKDRKGKNAITIFGEVFSWDEYEKLLEMKNNIKIIAANESRAILSKIMDSTKGFMGAVRVRNFDEKKKRVWRLSYYLRNCSREKDKVEELIKIYEDLALNRESKDYTNGSIIPVATRLAEFETRKEKN